MPTHPSSGVQELLFRLLLERRVEALQLAWSDSESSGTARGADPSPGDSLQLDEPDGRASEVRALEALLDDRDMVGHQR